MITLIINQTQLSRGTAVSPPIPPFFFSLAHLLILRTEVSVKHGESSSSSPNSIGPEERYGRRSIHFKFEHQRFLASVGFVAARVLQNGGRQQYIISCIHCITKIVLNNQERNCLVFKCNQGSKSATVAAGFTRQNPTAVHHGAAKT